MFKQQRAALSVQRTQTVSTASLAPAAAGTNRNAQVSSPGPSLGFRPVYQPPSLALSGSRRHVKCAAPVILDHSSRFRSCWHRLAPRAEGNAFHVDFRMLMLRWQVSNRSERSTDAVADAMTRFGAVKHAARRSDVRAIRARPA